MRNQTETVFFPIVSRRFRHQLEKTWKARQQPSRKKNPAALAYIDLANGGNPDLFQPFAFPTLLLEPARPCAKEIRPISCLWVNQILDVSKMSQSCLKDTERLNPSRKEEPKSVYFSLYKCNLALTTSACQHTPKPVAFYSGLHYVQLSCALLYLSFKASVESAMNDSCFTYCLVSASQCQSHLKLDQLCWRPLCRFEQASPACHSRKRNKQTSAKCAHQYHVTCSSIVLYPYAQCKQKRHELNNIAHKRDIV